MLRGPDTSQLSTRSQTSILLKSRGLVHAECVPPRTWARSLDDRLRTVLLDSTVCDGVGPSVHTDRRPHKPLAPEPLHSDSSMSRISPNTPPRLSLTDWAKSPGVYRSGRLPRRSYLITSGPRFVLFSHDASAHISITENRYYPVQTLHKNYRQATTSDIQPIVRSSRSVRKTRLVATCRPAVGDRIPAHFGTFRMPSLLSSAVN